MQSADSLIDKRMYRNVQSNLKTENYFYLIDEVSIKVLLLLSLLLHVHYLLNVYVLIKVFKECERFVLLLPPQSLIGGYMTETCLVVGLSIIRKRNGTLKNPSSKG